MSFTEAVETDWDALLEGWDEMDENDENAVEESAVEESAVKESAMEESAVEDGPPTPDTPESAVEEFEARKFAPGTPEDPRRKFAPGTPEVPELSMVKARLGLLEIKYQQVRYDSNASRDLILELQKEVAQLKVQNAKIAKKRRCVSIVPKVKAKAKAVKKMRASGKHELYKIYKG